MSIHSNMILKAITILAVVFNVEAQRYRARSNNYRSYSRNYNNYRHQKNRQQMRTHRPSRSSDPFDNSDLGPVVTAKYQSTFNYCQGRLAKTTKYCKRPLRQNGQTSKFTKNNQGFKLGDIDIPSFRLSCKNSHYVRNNTYCGLIVYDVGTCARSNKNCKRMLNGYAIIFHEDKYDWTPLNPHLPQVQSPDRVPAHRRAAYEYFGEWPTDLKKKYGMRFAGFSVREDGNVRYGSGTFNAADNTIVTDNDKDESRYTNAYEAAMIYMLVDKWKEMTEGVPEYEWIGGKTIKWNETEEYFKWHKQEIRQSFQTYVDSKSDIQKLEHFDAFDGEFV